MAGNRCRVCQRPVWWTAFDPLCQSCFTLLHPEAAKRIADTEHARRLARDAATYERARQDDEANGPPRRRRRE